YTILSGSTMLPEVREAMAAASQHYVHLDELAEAVGARLAELTKAEWGLVTVGCAAALTHATAACVAGGNPDLHVRIPNLAGFPRDEVVIPKHSRNVYDAALRAVGVRVIEVSTPAELEAALGPKTALVYILAGPEADESPLDTKVIASMAQARNVPVLVDAAAEILTVPNVHLQNGATLVAYSGGKCLRGPQAPEAVRPARRGGGQDAVRYRPARRRVSGARRLRARAHRRLGASLHDGARRREGRRRPPLRDPDRRPGQARRRSAPRRPRGRPQRPVGRAHRVRGRSLGPRPQPAPARQRDRRRPPR